MKKFGFTLIELLIAVTVIAVLATIAVVNLQDAVVRAKISRVQADFHTIETALEGYRADADALPPTNDLGTTPTVLSTPVAYLAQANMRDPLFKSRNNVADDLQNSVYRYNIFAGGELDDIYGSFHRHRYGDYWMYSNAPYASGGRLVIQETPLITSLVAYNVTNGTVSAGRLIRGPKYR